MRPARPDRTPQWSQRDSALWHTCDLVVDLAAGRPLERLLDVSTPFPLQFGPDEEALAEGPYELLEQRAPGDGTYRRDEGIFFATGPVGLAATAAVAVGRAVGNSSRRRAAQAAAIPRWMPIDRGALYVSSHGMYLLARSLYPWPWSAIRVASMVGPGALHLAGDSAQGAVSWVLRSDWAELLFAVWALRVHPAHRQLRSGGWLPPDWLSWAARHYPSRMTTAALVP